MINPNDIFSIMIFEFTDFKIIFDAKTNFHWKFLPKFEKQYFVLEE